MRYNNEKQQLKCPVCGKETPTVVAHDTFVFYFPLYCPNCEKEYMVNALNFNVQITKTQEY
ncbi:MAG: cysteine-rich KTR domain-containing protein [Clostridia bacterium]|nr:cysteine-rich KTR domain-containing protein [Clostridia bacterium]